MNATNLILSLGYAMAQSANTGGVTPAIALGSNLYVYQLPATASSQVSAVLRTSAGRSRASFAPCR